jgi:solute carrier family 10 (sodium/bile acid cotransporter), member 7
MMKLKLDWFLIGMAIAVVLAWLFPQPGTQGGVLYPELLTKGGVALVFFLHGLLLSFAALKSGSLRWPLHMVVQGTTFLLFPLLGSVIFLAGKNVMPFDLASGFFYLCALPSTVSSSIALTAVARGNVGGAVFNATLSSLLGIMLTPLWVSLMLKSGGQMQPLGHVMGNLVLWLLLPLLVGQLVRPVLGSWALRHKKWLNRVDRFTILLLVYTSFCESFDKEVWTGHGVLPVFITFAGACVILAIMLMLTKRICNIVGFNREDTIAAIFCGSKKSLAAGIPMAQLIFGVHPGLSLILLPIMLYHPLQLVVGSVLAGKWADTPPS